MDTFNGKLEQVYVDCMRHECVHNSAVSTGNWTCNLRVINLNVGGKCNDFWNKIDGDDWNDEIEEVFARR